jgi:hypothetical protein
MFEAAEMVPCGGLFFDCSEGSRIDKLRWILNL